MLKERAGSVPAGASGGRKAPAVGPLIRRAVPEDVPGLERLIGRSVLGLQAHDYDGRVLDSALRNGLLTLDLRLISDGTYYVAEVDGRIAGAGRWSRRRKIVNGASDGTDADDLLDPAMEAARVRAFYVHPGYARRGIGSRLLRTSELAAWRAGFRRLELISTLTGAPLYAARGWQSRERLEIELSDGQAYPAIRMTRTVRRTVRQDGRRKGKA